jgi:hypothetical protein
MSTTLRSVKTGAVAAFALGALFAPATAPAQAVPNLSISSHFSMTPVAGAFTGDGFPAEQSLDVKGVVAMSQAAAQDSINHGYTVMLRYWGDDPNSDDLLYGPIAAPNVFAATDGLHFQHNVTLPHSVVDEDNTFGVLDDPAGLGQEQDELYVGARFLDPSGNTVSLVESNRINGVF